MLKNSFLLLSVFSLFLAGCATGPTGPRRDFRFSECEQGDWFEMGLRDGAAGFDASQLQIKKRLCSPNFTDEGDRDYLRGLRLGRREYCTPKGVFIFAARDWGAPGTCYTSEDPKIKQAVSDARRRGFDLNRVYSVASGCLVAANARTRLAIDQVDRQNASDRETAIIREQRRREEERSRRARFSGTIDDSVEVDDDPSIVAFFGVMFVDSLSSAIARGVQESRCSRAAELKQEISQAYPMAFEPLIPEEE